MKNGSDVLIPGAIISLATLVIYTIWAWSGIKSRGSDSSVLQLFLSYSGFAAIVVVTSLIITGWLYIIATSRKQKNSGSA